RPAAEFGVGAEGGVEEVVGGGRDQDEAGTGVAGRGEAGEAIVAGELGSGRDELELARGNGARLDLEVTVGPETVEVVALQQLPHQFFVGVVERGLGETQTPRQPTESLCGG